MTDWKNTPEGRAAAQKYGDILPLSRPEPSRKHPRMPLGSRAKIFSPFAALRGFDEELSEESARTRRVPRADLSEEEQAALSEKLARLARGDGVTVRYFCPDRLRPENPPVGSYETVTGYVQEVDPAAQLLRLERDAPHQGPGIGKGQRLDIPLEDVEAIW